MEEITQEQEGQAKVFRENYLWRSCRDGFLNFIMKIKLSFLCMFSILETQLA